MLRKFIRSGTDVALLDVPNQRNIGDSLIWLGELEYLRALQAKIAYVADITTYDPSALRAAMPSGVVLIHGGGNLGDVWLGHQDHRERLVGDLVDYPIVQLPQSVHFRSRERAALANDRLAQHGSLTALLRDDESMRRATDLLPDVDTLFCHDMALGAAINRSVPSIPLNVLLVLARQDREAASGLGHIPVDWVPEIRLEREDWTTPRVTGLAGTAARLATKPGHLGAKLRRKLGTQPVSATLMSAHQLALSSRNRLNVDRGVELLEKYPVIVTDRLHAHVMSALLGIPHITLDNDSRKVSAVYKATTGRFSTAYRAENLDEAKAMAIRLFAQARKD
ncbi:polysaccharide pyruvyl transferase family protein [Ilumatobacter fluminis]|uniref:polysaccharide pyruvyl transferase family protein n=1 Tax=Ilumatobacter fluminis TaxID=467091 RepID=UPI0014151742|nr:polysaccharide pyruvyl transferase family protein [Ilumatobacter fluminis]